MKNNSDDGGNWDALNVGIFLPDYTASHSKRGEYSKASLNSHDGGE
jgi:hypothetical protein